MDERAMMALASTPRSVQGQGSLSPTVAGLFFFGWAWLGGGRCAGGDGGGSVLDGGLQPMRRTRLLRWVGRVFLQGGGSVALIPPLRSQPSLPVSSHRACAAGGWGGGRYVEGGDVPRNGGKPRVAGTPASSHLAPPPHSSYTRTRSHSAGGGGGGGWMASARRHARRARRGRRAHAHRLTSGGGGGCGGCGGRRRGGDAAGVWLAVATCAAPSGGAGGGAIPSIL